MEEERLDGYLAFIKETELLKNVLRTAWGSAGRQESTAEHSWRLALFAALMLGEYPELDGKRRYKYPELSNEKICLFLLCTKNKNPP